VQYGDSTSTAITVGLTRTLSVNTIVFTVRFEWTAPRTPATKRTHGLAFDDAALVFAGRTLTFPARRTDYGEPRYVTVGTLAPDAWSSLRTRRAATRPALSR
jgi:uncharacterized DUF497 family protein